MTKAYSAAAHSSACGYGATEPSSAAPGAAAGAKTAFEAMIPAKRYGTADEVASLALFLASDESRYISGGTYSIDGGMSVN
jgi:NAD(P)-dependent dehydrogenase (short-subunit alcohol dehydrogenase family)